MSKIEVDAIEPQSGTTLTIGASGDTVNIASGATITDFTSTGIDDNATSTAITIDSSENVGIGETSPGTLLDIKGVAGANNRITFNTTDAGINGNVLGGFVAENQTDSVGQITVRRESAVDDGYIVFETQATGGGLAERMRIDSSGKVGINTSSPGSELHVVADDVSQSWSAYDGTVLTIENNDTDGCILQTVGRNTATNEIWFGDDDSRNIGRIRYEHSDDGLEFWTNNSERMRIDSSGNVGIGTSSPESLFHIESDSADPTLRITNKTVAAIDTGPDIEFWNNPFTATTVNSYESGAIRVRKTNGSNNNHDHYMSFWTRQNSPEGINERMRITSSGDVFIAKTGTAIGTVGIELDSTGSGAFTTSAVPVLYVNRLTDDGDLIRFFQASTEEGSISVSGGTVSYNGFTGTHWSRFTDNSTPNILKGTVLESLDEMCDWYNLEFDVTTQDAEGNDVTTPQKIPHILLDAQSNGDVITYNHEGIDVQATIVKENDVKHMMSKVSDNSDAKNVYGVFVAYDEDGEGYNDFYVASVGSFVVRIKANETIAKGDLLQSNGDGTAKVQTDDAVRSSSFAKVLSTTIIETYDDGSYLVPCSLMC
jgi:hypothetical protein